MSLPEAEAACGTVRDLSRRYKAGGPKTFQAFRELASLLLSLTVKRPTSQVRLVFTPGKKEVAVLGGAAGPTDPVELNDGNFLRVSVGLYLGDRSDGRRLKVSDSAFQYQLDRAGEQWVVRYDYLRIPRDPHPTAHVQINGDLAEAAGLPGLPGLARLHFPTGRVGIEAVIRLLAEEFAVPCNKPSEVWRPVLAASEREFLGIAHQPLSGPEN